MAKRHILFDALILFMVFGCASSGGGDDEEAIPEGKGRLSGLVTDHSGIPLEGVSLATEAGSVTTDDTGRFRMDAAPGRSVIKLSKEGYAASSIAVTVTEGADTPVLEGLLKRSEPVSVDMGVGGTVGNLARVILTPGSLVTDDGDEVEGEVAAYITGLDIMGDLAAAPGDFSAVEESGSETRLETFGMAEYYFEDSDGNPLNVAEGVTLAVEMAIPDELAASAGDIIPAWHFDLEAGRWVEEGEGEVVEDGDGGLIWRAEVSHFSWWNADVPIDERDCVTGTITDCNGEIVSGASVRARGVDYRGESSDYPGASGRYCIDIKRGAEVDLLVVGTVNGNTVGKRAQITGGDSGASCGDGGGGCSEHNIELPCESEESDLDCTDSPLLPCSSCLAGRVVTPEGDPVENAVVTLGEAYSGFGARAIVEDDGTFCLPAPLDVPVELTVNASGFPPFTLEVVATEEGECPDCTDIGDVVLEERGSGDTVIERCNQGDVTMEAIELDGADELLAELPYVGMMLLDDESGDSLTGYLWMSDADDAENTDGSTTLFVTMEIPKGAEAGESVELSGLLNFNSNGVVGVSSEVYEVSFGSLTWNEAVEGAGQMLTGNMALELTTNCGMAVRTIVYEGSFSTEILDFMSYVSMFECVEFTAAFGGIGQTAYGAVDLEVDGEPIGSTSSSMAMYSAADGQLSLNVTEQDGIMFGLTVYDAAFGAQIISDAWISDSVSGCYWQATDVPELIIDENDEQDLGIGPMSGSFTAELSLVTGDCADDTRAVAGDFIAAICSN